MSPEKTPIDAVIFDYGEVIALADEADWNKMAQVANIARPSFDDAYWRYRLDYDRVLTPTEYWSKVAHDAGTEFSPETIRELTQADAAHWTHLNPVVLDWIESLKRAGKKLGLISNMPSGIAPEVRKLPFLEEFASVIFSCDLHVVKPAPEIYEAALKELQVSPERALFLDDKDYNVNGARALGMHGIVFDSLSGIEDQLAKFDLPTH